MDFLILHLRGECFVRTWPESAIRTWPDPYSCRAAVRCPKASSARTNSSQVREPKSPWTRGRRSAPPASLLDKAVGSNVPAETLRESGSRQQRPVLAYSSQVRRTFFTYLYDTYTPPIHLCTLYILYLLYLHIVLIKRESSRLWIILL